MNTVMHNVVIQKIYPTKLQPTVNASIKQAQIVTTSCSVRLLIPVLHGNKDRNTFSLLVADQEKQQLIL